MLSNWGSAGDVQINHKKTVPYPAARTWDGLSVLGVISGFPSKSLRHLYAILVFASDAMHQNISTSNIVKPLRYVCLRNFGLPHQDRKNHRRTPIPNFIVPHSSFVFHTPFFHCVLAQAEPDCRAALASGPPASMDIICLLSFSVCPLLAELLPFSGEMSPTRFVL